MTWVKLGEERVNTEALESYKRYLWNSGASARFKEGAMVLRVTVINSQDSEYFSDPDGALLAVLDAACFPAPYIATLEGLFAFNKDGHLEKVLPSV